MTQPFRVAFVPGVTPDKWFRTWAARMPGIPLEPRPVDEDDQVAVLASGAADMCFVRLPVERGDLHVIPLYREVPVVVAARDHPVAAFDEIDVADLADEHLLQPVDAVPEWREVAREVREGSRTDVPVMTMPETFAVVAAGSGIVIVPLSVARLHHRKDVVHRPVTGVAESQIGLAWRRDDDDPRTETFVGIVRGRTERSSRGAQAATPTRKKRRNEAGTKGTAGRPAGRRGAARRRRPR